MHDAVIMPRLKCPSRVPVRARAGTRARRRSRRGYCQRIDSRKEIVRAGYDALGERYVEWSQSIEGDPRDRFVDEFIALLDDGAKVLDLGCGPGIPSTQRLAQRFDVVGVDVSERQVALARQNVPGAQFVCADFADLDFPDASFGGITALYSLTHVPRDEHATLFETIARRLKPGGVFLATLSVGGSDDWVGEWVGVPMFFSCYDSDTSRRLLKEAGFELLADEVVEMREPEEGIARFLWIIARRHFANPS